MGIICVDCSITSLKKDGPKVLVCLYIKRAILTKLKIIGVLLYEVPLANYSPAFQIVD